MITTFNTLFAAAKSNNQDLKELLDETLYETPDQILSFLSVMVPNRSVFSDDHTKDKRKSLREKSITTLFNFMSEQDNRIQRGKIKAGAVKGDAKHAQRFLNVLYEFGYSEAQLQQVSGNNQGVNNEELTVAKLGTLYSNFIMNLPSYDPQQIIQKITDLTDEKIPDLYIELYPLIYVSLDADNVLSKQFGLGEYLSEECKARLQKLAEDQIIFSYLQAKIEKIINPLYMYIDIDKLIYGEENVEALEANLESSQSKSNDFGKSVGNINSIAASHSWVMMRMAKIALEKAGIPLNEVTVTDICGEEHNLIKKDESSAGDALRRGKPLFCTYQNKLVVFASQNGRLEVMPKNSAYEHVNTMAKNIVSRLNSSAANPFWMITGSFEYYFMRTYSAKYQKAWADYQTALFNRSTDVDAKKKVFDKACQSLVNSVSMYLCNRKKVDLKKSPDFKTFQQNNREIVNSMSTRGLARMKAAYSAFALLQATNTLYNEMEGKDWVSGISALSSSQDKDSPIRNVFLSSQANDPNVIRTLCGDLTKALFFNTFSNGIQLTTGLLNDKLYFTAEDRETAKDVLAKAVILSMLRTENMRKNQQLTPLTRYCTDAKNVNKLVDAFKNTNAFKNAVSVDISPDRLRHFFLSDCLKDLTKNILNTENIVEDQKNLFTVVQVEFFGNVPSDRSSIQEQQPQQQQLVMNTNKLPSSSDAQVCSVN